MSVQAKCNLVELGSGLNESYIKILERKQEADPELQHLHLSMSDNSESNRFLYQHRTIIKMFAISILVFAFKLPRTCTNTKKWNAFISPSADATRNVVNTYNPYGEFKFHMQIGSRLYPEYPIRSHTESYYQLTHNFKHQSSSFELLQSKPYNTEQTSSSSELARRRCSETDLQVSILARVIY